MLRPGARSRSRPRTAGFNPSGRPPRSDRSWPCIRRGTAPRHAAKFRLLRAERGRADCFASASGRGRGADLAPELDETRNCGETGGELLLRQEAEVVFDRDVRRCCPTARFVRFLQRETATRAGGLTAERLTAERNGGASVAVARPRAYARAGCSTAATPVDLATAIAQKQSRLPSHRGDRCWCGGATVRAPILATSASPTGQTRSRQARPIGKAESRESPNPGLTRRGVELRIRVGTLGRARPRIRRSLGQRPPERGGPASVVPPVSWWRVWAITAVVRHFARHLRWALLALATGPDVDVDVGTLSGLSRGRTPASNR